MPRPQCPPIAADIITEIGDKIVLIERKNFPHGWAIPGGFVDFGETVEQAAMREPRGQTITIVYIARASGEPRAADDAKTVALFDPRKPPSPLAFDHAEILTDYVHFLETGELPAP